MTVLIFVRGQLLGMPISQWFTQLRLVRMASMITNPKTPRSRSSIWHHVPVCLLSGAYVKRSLLLSVLPGSELVYF